MIALRIARSIVLACLAFVILVPLIFAYMGACVGRDTELEAKLDYWIDVLMGVRS